MEETDHPADSDKPDLLTIRKAANLIGIQYRALLNGVNLGLVPFYRLGKSRRFVCVHEVMKIMKSQGENQ